MGQVEYGAIDTQETIDANGSTVTRQENLRDGVVTRPVKVVYRIRKRVHNQKEEHEEYLNFSILAAQDDTMLDTAFAIERPRLGLQNGYYYVVQCYTRLER